MRPVEICHKIYTFDSFWPQMLSINIFLVKFLHLSILALYYSNKTSEIGKVMQISNDLLCSRPRNVKIVNVSLYCVIT